MVPEERDDDVGVLIGKGGYEGLVIGTGGHGGEGSAGGAVKSGESVGMIGRVTVRIVQAGVKGVGYLWENGEEVCDYV